MNVSRFSRFSPQKRDTCVDFHRFINRLQWKTQGIQWKPIILQSPACPDPARDGFSRNPWEILEKSFSIFKGFLKDFYRISIPDLSRPCPPLQINSFQKDFNWKPMIFDARPVRVDPAWKIVDFQKEFKGNRKCFEPRPLDRGKTRYVGRFKRMSARNAVFWLSGG